MKAKREQAPRKSKSCLSPKRKGSGKVPCSCDAQEGGGQSMGHLGVKAGGWGLRAVRGGMG